MLPLASSKMFSGFRSPRTMALRWWWCMAPTEVLGTIVFPKTTQRMFPPIWEESQGGKICGGWGWYHPWMQRFHTKVPGVSAPRMWSFGGHFLTLKDSLIFRGWSLLRAYWNSLYTRTRYILSLWWPAVTGWHWNDADPIATLFLTVELNLSLNVEMLSQYPLDTIVLAHSP